MAGWGARLGDIGRDTLVCSGLYLAAFFLTFKVLMPVQGMFFPTFPSYASLLFLPHGIRVLTAWLLGWRSVIALLPGVFVAFAYLAGPGVFEPSRLMGIAVAVLVAPATFQMLASFGRDLAPRSDRFPCWPCVMGAGLIASLVGSILTNLAFGSEPVDFVAYVIGDMAGLFFLMLILMLVFRRQRRS